MPALLEIGMTAFPGWISFATPTVFRFRALLDVRLRSVIISVVIISVVIMGWFIIG